eukprot:scaffold1741_cov262-Pinguiococcus_pyrenoidosus.AAC.21
MEFGLKARDLILELKRSDGVPPHNDDQLRRVLAEVSGLWEEIEAMTPDDVDPNSLPDGEKVRRALLKRWPALALGLSLLRELRARRLQRMRWSTGPVLPKETAAALSTGEKEFFRRYDSLVSTYSDAVGMDLTADITPPTELNLAVRALKDVGEVMTVSGGSINLQMGCQYSLRRADVDQLLRQGIVELIDTEE